MPKGREIGRGGAPKREPTVIGSVPIRRTDGLYFLGDGGTFKQGAIVGSFGASVGGAALVVYIDGTGESYELTVKDMIEAIIAARKG